MKHVTYAEKAHFLGDEAADTLIEYASALGSAQGTDTVTVQAIDDHGNAVAATFLLNPSTLLLVESSSSEMVEPDNDEAVGTMREKMRRMTEPPAIRAEDQAPVVGPSDTEGLG